MKQKQIIGLDDGLLDSFLSRQRAVQAGKLLCFIKGRDRILDLGCGICPYFLQTVRFREKHGIERAAESGIIKGVKLTKFDIEAEEEIPFRDDFFDAVTMLAVFEHIEPARLPGVMREVRRILRPGGALLLTIPAGWTHQIIMMLAKMRIVNPVMAAEHKDAYNFRKVTSFLMKGGFDRDKIRYGCFEFFLNMWFVAAK